MSLEDFREDVAEELAQGYCNWEEAVEYVRERWSSALSAELRAKFNVWHKQYLQTVEWKFTRKKCLRRDYYTCRICGAPAWQVHHLNYEYAKDNPNKKKELNYCISLCCNCHAKQKGKISYDTEDTYPLILRDLI